MKRITIVAVALLSLGSTVLVFGDEGGRRFRELLNGFKEAAAPISTTGTGTFAATINKDETEIDYVLTFENLEGDVRQAHIHIGYPQNSGGIVLWLCDSPTNPSPSATTPECTQSDPGNLRAGHVTGTLTAADVQAGLPDPPSYSSVRGMLRLLESKGFLRHEWDGPRYVYLPTADPERVRETAVQHLLSTFFSGSMESAVAAMLGASEKTLTDEELKRMARLIDDARRKRGRT